MILYRLKCHEALHSTCIMTSRVYGVHASRNRAPRAAAITAAIVPIGQSKCTVHSDSLFSERILQCFEGRHLCKYIFAHKKITVFWAAEGP